MSVTAVSREARWFGQNLAYVKVAGSETAGAYAVVELSGPRGDMPPLHVHHREEEAFYVLEGSMTLILGDDELRLEPGECAVAPRGIPHVYRVDSPDARWLTITSPAGFDEFVLAASSRAESETLPEGPPAFAPDELGAIAARFGIELLGPPGTLP